MLKNLIPPELMQELQERFPPQFPKLSWNEKKIWFEAGKAEFMTFLQDQFKQQQDTLYNRTVFKDAPDVPTET